MKSKIVLAERKFFLSDNPNKIITLKIIAPSETDPDFHIEMDGVDSTKFPCMFGGSDSLQAFMQTARLLKLFVDDINQNIFQGKLRWEGDPDGGLVIYNLSQNSESK